MKIWVAKLGNLLYGWEFLYRALYSTYKRISDAEERKLLSDIVVPGMTVVDVGANIGIYTAYLSKLVGSRGRVIAFEPEPKNYRRLCAYVHGLENVEPVEAAVVAQSGDIELFVSNALNVDHQTYDSGENRSRIRVRGVALDDYFPRGSRIDLIKMDVQGAEAAVLQGAERLLGENPDVRLILEYWPYGLKRAGAPPARFLEWLREMGFEFRAVGSSSGKNVETIGDSPDDYVNLYASRGSVTV